MFAEENSAEDALTKARELSLGSKSAVAEHQMRKSAVQAEIKLKTRQQGLAAAKVNEVKLY